jgi:stearoyl-CoA desaturase (Delta-9 desaturase)
MLNKMFKWLDNDTVVQSVSDESGYYIDWWRVLPFIGIHLACLAVLWVGVSWFALIFALVLYSVRMFAVTGFYHRYFSHKAYRTSRAFQFVLAVLGATAVQRGPLWWASHHRHHHVNSDGSEDAHSPIQHGFIWSHFGWFLANKNFATHAERVKEFARFSELRWLDRFDTIVPMVLAVSIYCLGAWLETAYPALQTNGVQLLVWGFAISTVALYHATFTVNSLAHIWGKRRYATKDHSRNNLWIAIVTMGEGWHNNHNHYPGSARQGFYWWEIDLTYYGLKVLAALGLIWDLRTVPAEIRDIRKIKH